MFLLRKRFPCTVRFLKAALCKALTSKLEMFVKREKEKNEIQKQKQVPKFTFTEAIRIVEKNRFN